MKKLNATTQRYIYIYEKGHLHFHLRRFLIVHNIPILNIKVKLYLDSSTYVIYQRKKMLTSKSSSWECKSNQIIQYVHTSFISNLQVLHNELKRGQKVQFGRTIYTDSKAINILNRGCPLSKWTFPPNLSITLCIYIIVMGPGWTFQTKRIDTNSTIFFY